eukprot:TRINITY_DN19544_c0_g2_i1.p1 TRINITY_DN19544_c0_g2~~TRINITY_DN19544_c0_g2_i1.p1  ORF type:complete len:658 (+),score=281.99 TRINITY_DN19544_c0_g2_i1:107-2080(+)
MASAAAPRPSGPGGRAFHDFKHGLRTIYIDEGVEVEGLNSAANVRDIVAFAKGVHEKAKGAGARRVGPGRSQHNHHHPTTTASDYAWGQDSALSTPPPASPEDRVADDKEEAAAHDAVFTQFLDMNRRIRYKENGDNRVSLEELELWRKRFLPTGHAKRAREGSCAGASEASHGSGGGAVPPAALPSYCGQNAVSRPWRWIPTDQEYKAPPRRQDQAAQLRMAEEYLRALKEFEGVPVTQWDGAPEKHECPQCRQCLLCINCTLTRRRDPLREQSEYQMLCRAVTHVVEGMRREEEKELEEQAAAAPSAPDGGAAAGMTRAERERAEELAELHRKLQAKYNALMTKQPWCSWLKKKDYDLVALAKQQDEAIQKLREQHGKAMEETARGLREKDAKVQALETEVAQLRAQLKERQRAPPLADEKAAAATLLTKALRGAMVNHLRAKASSVQAFCDRSEEFVSSALQQLVSKIDVLSVCVKKLQAPSAEEFAPPPGPDDPRFAAVQAGLVRAVKQLWRAFDDCQQSVRDSIAALRNGAPPPPPPGRRGSAVVCITAGDEEPAEAAPPAAPRPPAAPKRKGSSVRMRPERRKTSGSVKGHRATPPRKDSDEGASDAAAPKKRRKQPEDHVFMKGDVYRQETVTLPSIRGEQERGRKPVAT